MLSELHVRSLALIDRADIAFGNGLNILTGETGAGKSILLGSINLALGKTAPKDIIRTGAEYAMVELVFSLNREEADALRQLDVEVGDDMTLIISRKIYPQRSTFRVNDAAVTMAAVKKITAGLMDIHGQHDHESLLFEDRHLKILDACAGSSLQEKKAEVAELYREYAACRSSLRQVSMDKKAMQREADFLEYEIGELESAAIKEGEEEELAAKCRLFASSGRIRACLSAAFAAADSDEISRAVRDVMEAAQLDEGIKGIADGMCAAEDMLCQLRRDIDTYLSAMSSDPEEEDRTQRRLDELRGIFAKYGGSAASALAELNEKKKRLVFLKSAEENAALLTEKLRETERRLEKSCGELTLARKKAGAVLAKRLSEALLELNFVSAEFSVDISDTGDFSAEGRDHAAFMISVNPGEAKKPLARVASGGELSRIMLAIKTVLADADSIDTLIFDEIDTGISGRTAQRVAEKLSELSRVRQVICITHLPQIAAMADCHFLIEKDIAEDMTKTRIRRLCGEEETRELARMLGGVEITAAVLENAAEMKRLAAGKKAAFGE